jgi:hypothetical protein
MLLGTRALHPAKSTTYGALHECSTRYISVVICFEFINCDATAAVDATAAANAKWTDR